jgi:hypothetical protein
MGLYRQFNAWDAYCPLHLYFKVYDSLYIWSHKLLTNCQYSIHVCSAVCAQL